MRIVWLSHMVQAFGAERAMVEAIGGLARLGVATHVVLPDEPVTAAIWAPFSGASSRLRTPWWVARPHDASFVSRARRVARFATELPRMVATLRRERPDLVVTNTMVTPLAAVAARLAGLPHVWYVHEFGQRDHGMVFLLGEARTLRWIGALSARVVVNSRAVGRYLADVIPEAKLRVVCMGVETPAAPPPRAPGSPFRLVMVGYVSPGKRQEDAIRALALLLEGGLDVALTIVGARDTDYGERLDRLVAELNVAGRVVFTGETTDPFSPMTDADLMLMCSRDEAFGRVTVEAMKLGTPVVGADSGGTADLIEDGTTGLLFRPGDSTDLATKISRVIADPALLAGLGKQAHVWASARFDPTGCAAELRGVFAEAIAERRRTAKRS